MSAFTYLQFHLAFVLPPLFVLAGGWARSTRVGRSVRPSGVAVVILLALVYTTPWDNYLVAKGVWGYGTGRVLATIWHAPLGEYLFVLFQTLLAALWLDRLRPAARSARTVTAADRIAGVGAGVLVGTAGAALLRADPTFYLGAILLWAGPVLAVQWGYDWPYLWRRRRLVALGVLVPTLYLCVVDRLALGLGIWRLSERYTTGIAIGGLPIEEATFFLLTNLFVVQALVLYERLLGRRDPVGDATGPEARGEQ